jgi:hypothetical protein
MAFARIAPTDLSPFAEIIPTWAMALGSLHGTEIFCNASIAAVAPLSMPRFKSIGSMPAATAFMPSRRMA